MDTDENALLTLVRSGDCSRVREEIERRRPSASELAAALSAAAFEGFIPVMKYLIEAGADVNERAPNGATPLDGAVENLNVQTIALLLSNGAKVNLADEFGQTALHRAIDCEVQQARQDPSWKGPPAADVTRLLVYHGADPNIKDHRGQAPRAVPRA